MLASLNMEMHRGIYIVLWYFDRRSHQVHFICVRKLDQTADLVAIAQIWEIQLIYMKTSHLMRRTMKQSPPTASPTLPIAAASEPREICNGVSTASPWTKAIVFPHSLSRPTAVTNILPLPSVTCMHERLANKDLNITLWKECHDWWTTWELYYKHRQYSCSKGNNVYSERSLPLTAKSHLQISHL